MIAGGSLSCDGDVNEHFPRKFHQETIGFSNYIFM